MGVTSAARPEWEGLSAFLHREVFESATALRIVEVARPVGGASWETFFVDLEVEGEGAARRTRVCLRRAPASGPMEPYEVSKDVTIFRALAKSDCPVPPLLAWTEDAAVFERPFSVTGFVEGEGPDITKVEQWSLWQEQREALGFEMLDTLAALHRFDWQGSGVESGLGPRGDARARMAGVVDRYLTPLLAEAVEARIGLPLWREIGAWLCDNAPDVPEADLVIVHGDYRFGNLLFQGTKVAAVLDWERAMLGPRMQDLGFLCMPLSRRRDPRLMAKVLPFDALARRYEEASGVPVDVGQVQYYAVLWQFLEGVNATRALVQTPPAVVATGVLAQPNLVATQTLEIIENHEAGRYVL